MRGTFVVQNLIAGLLALPWLNPFSGGPSPAIPALIFVWMCVATVLAIAQAVPRNQCIPWVQIIATAWILAAGVSVVAGLVQYFGHSDVLAPWVNAASRGVSYGNLRQRNQFATLTSIGLGAVLFWATSQAVSPPGRRVLLGLAALLACGNAASSSRTGLTQLLLLTGLAAVWSVANGLNGNSQRHRLTSLAVVWAAYLLASWALPRLAGLDPQAAGILGRLYEDAPVCSSRITLWGNVLHLIGQRPWTGWGWGNLDYAHFITLYPNERFCDLLDNAHNLPLHLAVELGIPLALCAVTGFVWLLVRARPWRENSAARQMAWSALAVVGIHSLLEYPLWYGPFQLAVLSCAFLLWPRCSRASGLALAEGTRACAWSRAPAGMAAALVLFAGAYAAWDYWRISELYLPLEERSISYREDTLNKVRTSWLFQDQVLFAELTTTPLVRSNADYIYSVARRLLHFSPEPRVVERLIESTVMLGRDDEALFYLSRFKAAYPDAHARWTASSARHKAP